MAKDEKPQEEKPAEIIINPAVPPELKELAIATTEAAKAHTSQGKAILLTELRRRYDVAVGELRALGYDRVAPDEKIMKEINKAFGKELAEVIVGEWHKAVGEGEIDGLPEGITDISQEKAAVNIAKLAGTEATKAVFGDIYKKAFWEGVMFMYAGFQKFKDDVLIENES